MINSCIKHIILGNKKASFIFFMVFFFNQCYQAQDKEYWLIDTQNASRKKVNDSISAVHYLDSLAQHRYFFTKVKKVKKNGNSIEIYFDKGTDYNQAEIHLSKEIQHDLKWQSPLFTKNIDSTKEQINNYYSEQGFIFNRIKTKFLGMKNNLPSLAFSVLKTQQRKMDKFVIKGYDQLPKRFLKNLESEFHGKPFIPKYIEQLNNVLNSHPYIQLTKVPQSLFRKDSTEIYLFLKKKKVNSFDGVIGFGNNKNDKVAFNGTLDVRFSNLFNGFESLNIFWQRQIDKGQTFKVEVNVPYLLKSNIGTRNQLHIYRQDTIFANVKFQPELYYSINNQQKIGLRGNFESSSVLDDTYAQADDFSKKGIGLTYEFKTPSNVDLFLYQSYISASADWVQTHYDKTSSTHTQKNYYVLAEKNIPIYQNHYLNIKAEGAFLDAKRELSYNEKLRFGGWNSLRGFNENSLLADYFYYGNLEYRYLINDNAFFDTFAQYGQLHNQNLIKNPQLYSFGLGFHLRLPVGLMSLQISNGSQFSQAFQFKQTKIHWGIVSRF